jgi:hypothetical protein
MLESTSIKLKGKTMKEHIQSLNPEHEDFWANYFKVQTLIRLLKANAEMLGKCLVQLDDRELIRESIMTDVDDCLRRDAEEMNGKQETI